MRMAPINSMNIYASPLIMVKPRSFNQPQIGPGKILGCAALASFRLLLECRKSVVAMAEATDYSFIDLQLKCT
uniref:ARF-related protein n=1 Tax=Arundo donax TaxID=35708 RepID=A0A0A9E438_ARUDO